MQISIRNSYEASKFQAELTVFVDVFRASTTLCYLLKNKAQSILGINDYELIKAYLAKDYQLISEVYHEGLDNSPSVVDENNLIGKNIIQRTGNFTEAIFNNLTFQKAIVLSFVNIDTVKNYILDKNFQTIDIVAASYYGKKEEAVEDISCAEMLQNLLFGKGCKMYPYYEQILLKITERKKNNFKFPEHYWTDLKMALERNTINLIPEIFRESKEVISFNAINTEHLVEI